MYVLALSSPSNIVPLFTLLLLNMCFPFARINTFLKGNANENWGRPITYGPMSSFAAVTPRREEMHPVHNSKLLCTQFEIKSCKANVVCSEDLILLFLQHVFSISANDSGRLQGCSSFSPFPPGRMIVPTLLHTNMLLLVGSAPLNSIYHCFACEHLILTEITNRSLLKGTLWFLICDSVGLPGKGQL